MPRIRDRLRVLGEFVGFARENRAYWVVPFAVIVLLVALVVVAGQGAAPLIYAMF